MPTSDARDQLVGQLWAEIRSVSPDNLQNYPSATRAIASGASPNDVVLAMTTAAYEAVFRTLYLLTGEEDIEALAKSGALNMLHEDLLSADPTGREGNDLFQ